MAQKDIGNKTPLHELKTTEEVMKYYDEWSKNNKYNNDMFIWEYSGPRETSEILSKYQNNKDIKIYDAGCGSGLVGLELKKYGFSNFDGGDISKESNHSLGILDKNVMDYSNIFDLDFLGVRGSLTYSVAPIVVTVTQIS